MRAPFKWQGQSFLPWGGRRWCRRRGWCACRGWRRGWGSGSVDLRPPAHYRNILHQGKTTIFLTEQGDFFGFVFSMFCIHCFICRPSDSAVSEDDAGIEPKTVATSALAVGRSNHYRLDLINNNRLDLIHKFYTSCDWNHALTWKITHFFSSDFRKTEPDIVFTRYKRICWTEPKF